MDKVEWDVLEAREKNALVAKRLGFGGTLSFTINRNACALVLDEIDKRRLRTEFEDALSDECDEPAVFVVPRLAIEWALRLNPDTICYAALKAVSDEEAVLS